MNISSPSERTKAERVSHCLKGLAHESRLMILMALRDGEKGVNDLAEMLKCAQPKVSQHLSKMRERGLLSQRREGNQIFYSITDKRVFDFLDLMRELFCK